MNVTRTKLFRVWSAFAIALASGSADAHLNWTGMGPVYDGVLHFLTSPEDLVPAIALALLAGLRGAEGGRRAVFTLPAAWLLGIVLGSMAIATTGSPYWVATWLLLTGSLVVFDAKLSLRTLTVLCVLTGLAHGYLNGSGLGPSVTTLVAALGIASTVFVVLVLVAAFVVGLQATWARTAVRVAGSWIAASGLLMLGWALRGN
jgi:urease accessory protein